MGAVLQLLWHGVRDALLMGWTVMWALTLGFVISGIVQAWVPRERIQKSLSGGGAKPLGLATGLGAASSSCSYAATAISKSLFQKGASAASALAFQIASTNLVWELGLVLWVLIGWQFTVAEYVGGIVMIVIMAVLLRLFISPQAEAAAREHAISADSGHMHNSAGTQVPLRERLTSVSAWSDVAHNFRGDLQMLYKEIIAGLLLSGFAAQLNQNFFHALFLNGSPALIRTVWGAIIGPLIAMLTFVCSVGNIPLAAVLWSGGISFAGVIAFIFADLLIVPLILIYRKYYGGAYALRMVALLLVTTILAALVVHALFGALGLIPSGPRPTRTDVFASVTVNYTLVLNVLAVIAAAGLLALTARRGASDPVCGMTVERSKALTAKHAGATYYFCCTECRDQFTADPERYVKSPAAREPLAPAGASGSDARSSGTEIKL